MWKLPINAEGERKHLLPKIRCVKNLEDVTVEQLQAEAR